MRETLKQISSYLVGATHALPARETLSHPMRAATYATRLAFRIVKQWARDKCPQQAAALAFQTALALVPIAAIAFLLLRVGGMGAAESQLNDFIANNLLPDMDDVADYLDSFSKNISVGAAGGLGIFFTLATCYSLYSYVERIFNDIWRVSQRRSTLGKFLTFYPLVTLLPVLAGVSLYWSGRLILAGAGPWARFFGPLAVQFAALLIMNKLLPRSPVRWPPAALGAAVSAFALEGLKFAFVNFAKKALMSSYSGIYGTLGLIPLLLLWMYLAWLMVLLGAEVAHAVQNLRLLEAEDRRKRDDEPINALVAAQLLAAIAGAHAAGGGATREALSHDFGLTVEIIDRIAQRLKARGLIAEVHGDIEGYIPGRPAASITMEDVLAAFRATDIQTAEGAASPALRQLVADLEQSRQARIAGVTIADLVPAPADPARRS